jgi:2-iminobutanoate/2-iminopropanoate deaminase
MDYYTLRLPIDFERNSMNKRRSIEVPGLKHKNPIPFASQIGSFLATGVIFPKNPQTGETPATIEGQCAQIFANIRTLMKEAGGTTDHVLKLSVFMRDKSQRPIVNNEWVAMFPNEHSRPARHVFATDDLSEGDLVEAEILAVIPE